MTDSHCHIAGEEFIADLHAVVDRAREAGVSRALVILAAEDEAEIARVASVEAAWPSCRFAVGVHPHQAHRFAANPSHAAALVALRLDALPSARAIGEIMAANPVPIIIPCHRVVASNGLGGYSGGEPGRHLETKRWVLEQEGALPPALV